MSYHDVGSYLLPQVPAHCRQSGDIARIRPWEAVPPNYFNGSDPADRHGDGAQHHTSAVASGWGA